MNMWVGDTSPSPTINIINNPGEYAAELLTAAAQRHGGDGAAAFSTAETYRRSRGAVRAFVALEPNYYQIHTCKYVH